MLAEIFAWANWGCVTFLALGLIALYHKTDRPT